MKDLSTLIIILLIDLISYILTLIKIKSMFIRNTLKRFIPFYWLYYIIKMNIKKYLVINKLEIEISSYRRSAIRFRETDFVKHCIEQIKIYDKTINKIKKL
jgi:hypothetical protein